MDGHKLKPNLFSLSFFWFQSLQRKICAVESLRIVHAQRERERKKSQNKVVTWRLIPCLKSILMTFLRVAVAWPHCTAHSEREKREELQNFLSKTFFALFHVFFFIFFAYEEMQTSCTSSLCSSQLAYWHMARERRWKAEEEAAVLRSEPRVATWNSAGEIPPLLVLRSRYLTSGPTHFPSLSLSRLFAYLSSKSHRLCMMQRRRRSTCLERQSSLKTKFSRSFH